MLREGRIQNKWQIPGALLLYAEPLWLAAHGYLIWWISENLSVVKKKVDIPSFLLSNEIKFVLTVVVMPDILKKEVTILAQNIYNQSAKKIIYDFEESSV